MSEELPVGVSLSAIMRYFLGIPPANEEELREHMACVEKFACEPLKRKMREYYKDGIPKQTIH